MRRLVVPLACALSALSLPASAAAVPGSATSAGARPSLASAPKRAAAPRATAKISFLAGGRVAVAGTAPRRSRVTVTLKRNDRVVGRRTTTASPAGRYRVTFRAPRTGTYRATVTARSRSVGTSRG